MSARVSGLAFLKIFLTMLAGISSRRSVASSAIILSMMEDASFSERDWMMYCWSSISRSAKTSAAMFLGRIRKMRSESSSSMSSMSQAMSTVFISERTSRSSLYFFSSRSLRRSFSSTVFSSKSINYLY